MDKYREIAELMKGFRLSGNVFFPAIVESIEGMTCTVKVDNLSISDVRLKATNEQSEDSILLTPAIGSSVLIGSISNDFDNLFVIRANALSEAFLKIGEMSFKLDKNGISINDGKNGGMVKIDEMVKWMQRVYTDLQTLKTTLQAHPVAGNGAPLAMVFSPGVPNPVKSTFEDKNAKH